jgi:hypothetical protein
MKVDMPTHAALHRVQRAMGHLDAAMGLFAGPDDPGGDNVPAPAYSEATAIAAEGARVGIVTCLVCGAAILLDPRGTGPDLITRHSEWHRGAGDEEAR